MRGPGDRPLTPTPNAPTSQAEWQSRWIAALNNRRFGDLALNVEVVPAATVEPAGGAWIRFDSQGHTLFLKPLLVGGRVPPMCDQAGRPDAALAAAAMGDIEAMVGAIERIAGATLYPVAVSDKADDGLRLAIEALDRGVVVHRALLVLPPGLPPAGTPLPLDPDFVSRTIPPLIARISGPSVAPAVLDKIEAGDLLLLGTGPLLAHFALPDRNTAVVARVDLQERAMVVERMSDGAAKRSPDAGRSGATDGSSVATVIEIDGTGLTHDRLAALADGSIVPLLAAQGMAPPVHLRAAGHVIAVGQLITVGDGHGVLVTERLPGSVTED